ncbi:hypothetical protein COT65_01345 [Candidatus Shapirobacteria bacterium CG09_land_8_20_14_0_10_47_13]|uniref:Sortase n=1 Tax=Candidatus Shapirobacteria bacterium CG09_land_8_20_14_0_10_47_13 TaxID=1974481 RepID=A0A2H0WMW4_9BACT|nr:MAG: hypothetical protein COT65_01345 [Candidatus Shapirobacteria bacterium CG09_land_8_20_14_0_10_47_13]
MALYCYLKAQPKIMPQPVTRPAPKTAEVARPRNLARYLPALFFVAGLIFLTNAFLPIAIYELKSQNFSQALISPVEVLGENNTVVDYSQPRSWFPTAPEFAPKLSNITAYNISIPKLKINQAVVKIGGEDLLKSLAQYPGTAIPGQYGNAVIFGHSVLPQFFNPKDYRTIFSTLPTLKEGDEILVNFDGIEYRYQVIKMVEVPPDDVSVLEQRYDREYLSLVTCVPPGTYLRRLVVRAKLVRL